MEIPKLAVEYTAKLCFACSQQNPIGLKLRLVYDGEKVTAEFTGGELHQGWNDTIHGGILYTLLDEATAYAMLCSGIEFGVTAKSEIRFKQPVPINEPIKASAWVTKLNRRLVETEGVLALRDGTVVVEGDFLFYVWRQSKRTFLWDMDGVIADTRSFHFAVWKEALAKRGIAFTVEDFARLFGTTDDFMIRSVTQGELSKEDAITIVQEKKESFQRRATGNIKPYPGAIRLLNVIKAGNFKLGLVSSAPKDSIDLITGELNLDGVFDCIVSGEEVSEAKPSPQAYLLATEKLGVAPEDCLVIEDSPPGIQAAKAAGMKCLAITNTHPRQRLDKADRVIDSLENVDLITLLTRI
jgi:HAD superfamily hydrolase (TIGR01509 family)